MSTMPSMSPSWRAAYESAARPPSEMPQSQMRERPRRCAGRTTESRMRRTIEPSANQAARTGAISTSASMPLSLTASGKPSRTKSSGSLYVPESSAIRSCVRSSRVGRWMRVRMRGF